MTPFKWASLAITILSSICVALVLLAVVGPQQGGGGFGVIVCSSLVIGLTLGAIHWLLSGRYSRELHRFAVHIDAINEDQSQSSVFPSHFGLGELAESVKRALDLWRDKLKAAADQRRELEIQLRIAEAERHHLEAILNTITDGVMVTDAFNEIALANESAARVLDFDLSSALRRPVDQIIHNRNLATLIKDTREGGNNGLRRHVEQRMGHHSGNAVYDVTLACVDASAPKQNPADADNAGSCGVVTILRDITREKEIAAMKSDFVSNVSHELRTPLSSIKAYMEMLIDGEADDEQTRAEFYNIIQGETNRLSRLIDNILNINRIESGIVKVQREHIDLRVLVKEALDVMMPQARAKQINLREEPAPDPCRAFADRDMILQCLLNLVGNAVKYTQAQGKITVAVGVDQEAGLATVTVRDSGVGIPSKDLPHLFDKFYRVADHKNLANGTGLGLNMVKHVIETVHGGKVEVTSEVGKGSTFTFGLRVAGND